MARDLEGGYPELAHSIHPHPAFAEAVLEAARADRWLADPRLATEQHTRRSCGASRPTSRETRATRVSAPHASRCS